MSLSVFEYISSIPQRCKKPRIFSRNEKLNILAVSAYFLIRTLLFKIRMYDVVKKKSHIQWQFLGCCFFTSPQTKERIKRKFVKKEKKKAAFPPLYEQDKSLNFEHGTSKERSALKIGLTSLNVAKGKKKCRKASV